MARPVIFISYSHEDEKEKDKLLDHLSVLQHEGTLRLWSDDQISPGADLKQEIGRAIAQARVVILLISANLLKSSYFRAQVPHLLQRRQSGGLTVFPVIAKPCAWRQIDWLIEINVRPKNGRAIWGKDRSRVEEDLAAIAEEVAAIVAQTGVYTTPSKQRIQVFLQGDFSSLSVERKSAAIDAFAAVMGVPPQVIEVYGVYEGSIKFDIGIPHDAAQRFRSLLELNDAQLRLLKVEKVIFEIGSGKVEEWIIKEEKFNLLTSTSSSMPEDKHEKPERVPQGPVWPVYELHAQPSVPIRTSGDDKRSQRVRNPFHYGGPVPPESFIGHRWAVDFCQARLTAQGPANIAISGERRIGKTSLLHYLREFGIQEAWGQYLGLFLDLGIFGGAVKPTAFWQHVLHLLKEKLDPTSPLVSQITGLQSQATLTALDFSQFLNHYRQLHPAQPLLLLLDEFEFMFQAYTPDIQNLLASLRALTLSTQKFVVVTVTRKPLSEVCQIFTQATQGLEFHSHFVPCPLEYFDEEETHYVVQTLLKATDISFTSQELGYIWDRSRGQRAGALPILVQVAASLVFEYKQRYTGFFDDYYLDRQFEKQTQLYRTDDPLRFHYSSLVQTTRASIEEAF